MNIKSIKLIKIIYELNSDDLDKLLFQKMSEEEKKWTEKLSKESPNESVVSDENLVNDILMVDEETEDKVIKMLNRLNLKFKIKDITNDFILNEKNFSLTLNEDIVKFLNNNINIDDILDRINEVGMKNLNEFEKKFLKIYNDGNRDSIKNT